MKGCCNVDTFEGRVLVRDRRVDTSGVLNKLYDFIDSRWEMQVHETVSLTNKRCAL